MIRSRCTTDSDSHFLAFPHNGILCKSLGDLAEIFLDGFWYCRQGTAIREVEDS